MDDKGNDHLPTKIGRARIRAGRVQERAARGWVERLEAALVKVAMLLDRDPAFAPVFERLEAEVEAAKRAQEGTDAQRRARALLDQKASPPINSAFSSKDPPLP